jgi:hypothetical protein
LSKPVSAARKRVACVYASSFPWGGGQIVEEAYVESEHHVPTIQLPEYEDGSLSVRFCSYSHAGRFQRKPMMASPDDLQALGRALRATPRLQRLVGALVTEASRRTSR